MLVVDYPVVGVSGNLSRAKWLFDNASTFFEPAVDLKSYCPLFLLEKTTFETRSRGVDVRFLVATNAQEILDFGVWESITILVCSQEDLLFLDYFFLDLSSLEILFSIRKGLSTSPFSRFGVLYEWPFFYLSEMF